MHKMTTIIIILSRMTKPFGPPFSGFCTGDRTLIDGGRSPRLPNSGIEEFMSVAQCMQAAL
jgi:hypothetical protein